MAGRKLINDKMQETRVDEKDAVKLQAVVSVERGIGA